MGGNVALGWMAHFVIGIVLARRYAAVFVNRLPGAHRPRRALQLLPWLMAQIVVMPMMGMGLLSGSMIAAGGSLMGHIVYDIALGAVYVTGASHAVTVAGARA